MGWLHGRDLWSLLAVSGSYTWGAVQQAGTGAGLHFLDLINIGAHLTSPHLTMRVHWLRCGPSRPGPFLIPYLFRFGLIRCNLALKDLPNVQPVVCR